MGCDIHMYAETKNKDGSWSCVGDEFTDPYYRADEPLTEWNHPKTDHPYSGRNYNLFAILADVRNGRGFAGLDTGDGFIPISEPKGLPDDVSGVVQIASSDWGADGHSHSWFTLKELLDYQGWEQTTKLRGVISEKEYQKWDGKEPDSYFGSIWGENTVTISAKNYDRMKADGGDFAPEKEVYIRVEWEQTCREAIGDGFFKTIEDLKKLGEPENVRIVFWFDN